MFARKGFAGASVDDIAETAGFTTGALYAHFASKEALFLEVLSQRSSNRMAEAAGIVSTDAGATVDELRVALNHLLAQVADVDADLAPLEAEIWLYAVRRPEALKEMAAQFRRNRDELAQVLAERAHEQGRAGADAGFDRIATVLMALFQGLVQLRRTDPDLVSEDLYGDAAHWMFSGLTRIASQPKR